METATAICIENGIGVGKSDPCFELWLILHYEEFDKSVDRHSVQKHLESLCQSYSRSQGKLLDCKALMADLPNAVARAAKQLKRRAIEGAKDGCPSTTVGHLVEAIQNVIAKKNRLVSL